jgi:hypothetical protein
MQGSSTRAGGCFLTLFILLGFLFGLSIRDPLKGTLMGTAIGAAFGLASWLIDRRRRGLTTRRPAQITRPIGLMSARLQSGQSG